MDAQHTTDDDCGLAFQSRRIKVDVAWNRTVVLVQRHFETNVVFQSRMQDADVL